MKLFNTLTRTKDEFVPLTPGAVKIYVCGPTVYNFIHIGNARPVCVFDTLRRYFLYKGYQVEFVQNITDIDDKLINRAAEEQTTVAELAERYTAEYMTDIKGLNAMQATHNPKATENIPRILAMIEELIAKGYAYAVNGDVYFRTAKFAEYGKLCHQPLEELQAGARIAVTDQKENPEDFALWKNAKPGEPFWETPWGKGRPGWHIECSAMVREYLGETIDIHAGGIDLVFPHHENEIAQSEACTGKPFANYWLHNAYLNIDNKKMSKSTGNFVTTRKVAEEFGYEPIRLMMLSVHYRNPLNYTVEVMNAAKASLERLANCKEKLAAMLPLASDNQQPADAALLEAIDRRKAQFEAAMDDDLNTADGMTALFELVRDLNTALQGELPGKDALQQGADLFEKLCFVMGLLQQKEAVDHTLTAWVEEKIALRKEAKKAKDFATADAIRQELLDAGIVIEDTRAGTTWKKA